MPRQVIIERATSLDYRPYRRHTDSQLYDLWAGYRKRGERREQKEVEYELTQRNLKHPTDPSLDLAQLRGKPLRRESLQEYAPIDGRSAASAEGPRRVRVLAVRVRPGSTLAMGVGEDVETGQTVHFAGDWRPMRDIGRAVEAGEEVVVDIDPWQIVDPDESTRKHEALQPQKWAWGGRHEGESGYFVRILKSDLDTLDWLSGHGYDGGFRKRASVVRQVPQWVTFFIPESKAWEVHDEVDKDPHAFLTSCGSSTLADALHAFLEEIV